MTALVNRIIDCSLVDGPGNRTAIFLQGCNYCCTYCHNPETIAHCSFCGLCVNNCPAKALSILEGKVVWTSEQCILCDQCIHICPHHASPRVTSMTVDAVYDRIHWNRPFIQGITISGGECTLWEDFLTELIPRIKALGLTCLLDSNGSCNFTAHRKLLDIADGVLLDVKSTTPEEYESITGAKMPDILGRMEMLAASGKLSEVRTVCSPDFLSAQTVRDTADVLSRWPDIRYKLIAYRPFGVREPFRSRITPPSAAFMQNLKSIADTKGLHNSLIT